jgi:hypothetical protein
MIFAMSRFLDLETKQCFVVKVPWPARGGGIILVLVAEQGQHIRVPWCGPSSTAKAHTEKLGVRSDTALASDDGPGLFIGPATNPELAQIARQLRRGSASKSAQPT